MRSWWGIVVILLLSVHPAEAVLQGNLHFTRRAERLVGTIEKFSRNTVDIRNDEDGRVKQLVIIRDAEKFKVGDHVRVWYIPGWWLIESIKKMTPVEYAPQQGKNNGYLLKSSALPKTP